MASFLRVHRHRIETDIREENNRGSGDHTQRFAAFSGCAKQRVAKETHAGITEWREGVPVGGIDEKGADADDHQNDHQLYCHHDRVEGSALLDSFYQDNGQDQRNKNSGKIKVRSGCDETGMSAAFADAQAVVEWRRPEDCRNLRGYLRKTFVEYRNELLEVSRPAVCHGCRADGVFE